MKSSLPFWDSDTLTDTRRIKIIPTRDDCSCRAFFRVTRDGQKKLRNHGFDRSFYISVSNFVVQNWNELIQYGRRKTWFLYFLNQVSSAKSIITQAKIETILNSDETKLLQAPVVELVDRWLTLSVWWITCTIQALDSVVCFVSSYPGALIH